MKVALVLGTNAGQADLIDLLNSKGWETHACSNKRIGPGCDLAHKFHLVSTTDVKAVSELATQIKADIVYSISSDSAITTATKVSEQLMLPTLLNSDIIDLFNNKDQFRAFLNSHNIGTVNFITVSKDRIDNIEWNSYPCVVKPTNSQGQRGVRLVENAEQLTNAVSEAIMFSSNGQAIVEEYLNGEEFSTNVIVQNGQILLNEFSDRIVFGNQFFGLPKGHGLPITYIDSNQLDIANQYVEKIITALNINDAVLYIQMKLKDNQPKVIEIAPRLDGCHIWRLIKHHRNIDLREWALNTLLGEKIDTQAYTKTSKFSRSELIFHHLPTSEKFSVNKLKLPKNPVYEEFRYSEGEDITPINGKLEVVGYYVTAKEK